MSQHKEGSSFTPLHSPSANAMLADRLVSALHKAWSKQKDEPGNGHRQHAYNKEAWQELATVIDEVTKTLLTMRSESTSTRDATLEECAVIADMKYADTAWHPDFRIAAGSIAFAIRELKGKS